MLRGAKETELLPKDIYKDCTLAGEANNWASLQCPGLFCLWQSLSSYAPWNDHFRPPSPTSYYFIFRSVIYCCTTDHAKLSGFKPPCYCSWLFGLGNLRRFQRQFISVSLNSGWGDWLGLEIPRWLHSHVWHLCWRWLYWLGFGWVSFSLSLHNFSSFPHHLSSQIIGLL